ncbi:MAG: CHAD domain-containing protein, partial [Verrucomicrobia bacterium]|nr:CHAD domain-containing protein [Verrucomicrobiota bacterium]
MLETPKKKQATKAPTRATPLILPEHSTPAQALCLMIANTLSQILPNAANIATGAYEPEHLHQLRVGMRRLRTVLRLYGSLSSVLKPGQEDAVAGLFRKLGGPRDRDVMAESLWPHLRAAHAPLVETPPCKTGVPDASSLLQAPGTQRLWADLLALSTAEDAAAQHHHDLRRLLSAPLQRLHRQIQKTAPQFDSLDDEGRHRLRRRIKRLRYAADLAGSLWPKKSVSKYIRRLKAAQAP